MANKDDFIEYADLSPTRSSDPNNSIVQKVTSLIPSSISKWFGKSQSVRRRDSDMFQNESFLEDQPPLKRPRMPEINSDNDIWPRNKLLNGTFQSDSVPLPTMGNKSPAKTTLELLNNIKPRQSLRTLNDYHKFDWSHKTYKKSNDDESIAGPSGLQKDNTKTTSFDKISLHSNNKTILENISLNEDENIRRESSIESIDETLLAKTSETIPRGTSNVSTKEHYLTSKKESSKRLKYDDKSFNSTRSLFSSSLLSRHNSTSLASRRPSFNASVFGTPNLIDTTLTTERIANSPFYSGRTMFGGASAYHSPSLKSRLNSTVQIKPSNEQAMKHNESASMSQTAKRILDALENFNSPVGDVQKIPRLSISSKQILSLEDCRKKLLNSRSPYVRSTKRLPTKDLSIPTVSDILQIKRRDKFLQHKSEPLTENKTSSAILTSPLPQLNLPDISLPIKTLPNFDLIKQPVNTYSSSLLTSTNGTVSTISSTSTNCKTETNQVPSPNNNNNNKINMFINSTQTSVKSKKKPEISSITYEFAPPIKIGTCTKSLLTINNFKFSKPINLKKEPDLNFKYPNILNKCELKRKPSMNEISIDNSKISLEKKNIVDTISTSWICQVCLKNNPNEVNKCVSCETSESKEKYSYNFNSQFKISSDKWECTSCLVRNNNRDERCVACTALRPGAVKVIENKSLVIGFDQKFQPEKDTWECKTCMIRNKNNIFKCIACETLKFPTDTTNSGFGKEFLKKSTEWECPSCMVRNSDSKNVCSCCEAPKPGPSFQPSHKITGIDLPVSTPFKFGLDKVDSAVESIPKIPPNFVFGKSDTTNVSLFDDKSNKETKTKEIIQNVTESISISSTNTYSNSLSNFKTSEGWDCPSCMVRNTNEKLSCPCCETLKPGSKSEQVKTITEKANSGIILPANTPFKFGIDKAETKMVVPSTKTSPTTTQNTNFSFGIPSSTVTSTSSKNLFSFGVPKTSNSTDNVKIIISNTPSINTSTLTVNTNSTPSVTATSEIILPPKGIDLVSSPSAKTSTTVEISPALASVPPFSTSVETSANNFSATSLFKSPNGPVTTVSSSFSKSSSNLFNNNPTNFGSTATSSTFNNISAESGFSKNSVSFENKSKTDDSTSLAKSSSLFSKSTPMFGSTNNTISGLPPAFAFGSNDQKTEKNTAFTFGTTSLENKPPPLFTFGSNENTTVSQTIPEQDKKPPLFTFGSSETPKSSTFSFTGSSATNFDFGSKLNQASAVATAVTPSSFNINSTSAKISNIPTFGTIITPAVSNCNNLFNLSSQPVQNVPVNPSFGAAAPVFGSTGIGNSSTSTFQFGATPNQTTPVFSFGNSNQGQTAQSNPNFSTGTFNFGSTQQSGANSANIPAFNPHSTPVFNFSSGNVTSFTASPSGTASTATLPRRIKKAVRRRPQM